jgi:hypothetical protein
MLLFLGFDTGKLPSVCMFCDVSHDDGPRSPQKSSLTKNLAFGHNEKVKSLGRGKKIWEIVKFFIHVIELSFQKGISLEIWFVISEVVTRNVTL